MPRKMTITLQDGTTPILTEGIADNELQLQELVKDNVDLIPIEEWGMTGPLMTIGRETNLASGAVDLVALTVGGDILVIEFKTGPQNSDFRSALAQLVDYGSDLWKMPFEKFEAAVSTRYFGSLHCHDPRVKGKTSLLEAAQATWPDATNEDVSTLRERIEYQLTNGAFSYVLMAQRFTPTVEKTIDYLNAVSRGPRFYAVELIRFNGDGIEAFESRTIRKPLATQNSGATAISEMEFLEKVTDLTYKESIKELFESFRGLGVQLAWGVRGASFRVPVPGRSEPLSFGWIFPPGVQGWMGLYDVTVGFDPNSVKKTPAAEQSVSRFLDTLANIPGTERVKTQALDAFSIKPTALRSLSGQLVQAVADFIEDVNKANHKEFSS